MSSDDNVTVRKTRTRKPAAAAATVAEVKKAPKRSGNRRTDEYVVEKIVQDRLRQGKTEYYIKWLNFSDSVNTWEPASNILDKKLISAYNSRKEKEAEAARQKLKRKSGGKAQSYVLEDIVGIRRHGGRIEYCVKWEDYPEEENTWEPGENIPNKSLLKKFSLPEEKRKTR